MRSLGRLGETIFLFREAFLEMAKSKINETNVNGDETLNVITYLE